MDAVEDAEALAIEHEVLEHLKKEATVCSEHIEDDEEANQQHHRHGIVTSWCIGDELPCLNHYGE